LPDKSQELYKGWIEAFVLACGDLTLAPFSMKATDDLDLDKVFRLAKENLIDDSLVDHAGFTRGYNESRMGFSTHPSNGEQMALLDRDTVTNLFTHPWRRAAANSYIRPQFETQFDLRRSGLTENVSIFSITEGGDSTTFKNAPLAEQGYLQTASDYNLLNTLTNSEADAPMCITQAMVDNADMQLAPYFAGEVLANSFALGRTPRDVPLISLGLRQPLPISTEGDYAEVGATQGSVGLTSGTNKSALFLDADANTHVASASSGYATVDAEMALQSLLVARTVLDGSFGGRDGIQDWQGNVVSAAGYIDLTAPTLDATVETINGIDIELDSYYIGVASSDAKLVSPMVFNTDSPGHITWAEWSTILTGMKNRFPAESLKILQATGRLKKTLPNGSIGELTSVGNSTFGALMANSVRDGYVTAPLPGFSVTSKLERTSQNGPLVVSGQYRGVGTPTSLYNIAQWSRVDDSNIVQSPMMDGSVRNFSHLNHQFVGEYMSGRKGYYAPPGIGERDITGPLGPDGRLTLDLMSIPRDAIVSGASPNGPTYGAGPTAYAAFAHREPTDMIRCSTFGNPSGLSADKNALISRAIVADRTYGAASGESEYIDDDNGIGNGVFGYGTRVQLGTTMHFARDVGFRRGAVDYHAPINDEDDWSLGGISRKLWYFDPNSMRIAGPSCRSMWGAYMSTSDAFWCDPYRLDPFVATSVWLSPSDYAQLEGRVDYKGLTIGFNSPHEHITGANQTAGVLTADAAGDGGRADEGPSEADFLASLMIYDTDSEIGGDYESFCLGVTTSGNWDAAIPGLVGVTSCWLDAISTDSYFGVNLHDLTVSAGAVSQLPVNPESVGSTIHLDESLQRTILYSNMAGWTGYSSGRGGTALPTGLWHAQPGLGSQDLDATQAPVDSLVPTRSCPITGVSMDDWIPYDNRMNVDALYPDGTALGFKFVNAELFSRSVPVSSYESGFASDGLAHAEFLHSGQYLFTMPMQRASFISNPMMWLYYEYEYELDVHQKHHHYTDGTLGADPLTFRLGSLFAGDGDIPTWGRIADISALAASFPSWEAANGANVADLESMLAWHSDGVLTAQKLRERQAALPNPWQRASEGEPGVDTYTYDSSEQIGIARGLSQRLRSQYLGEMAAGLSNDLMRDVQVIN